MLNQLVACELAVSGPDGVCAVSTVSAGDAVSAVRARDEAEERIRASRIEIMRGYAETSRCRRRALLEYFGVESPEHCGACDRCDAASAQPADVPGDASSSGTAGESGSGAIRIDSTVEHAEFGTGTVMGIEDDRLTVFFPEHGYKVLARAVFENGIMELGEAA